MTPNNSEDEKLRTSLDKAKNLKRYAEKYIKAKAGIQTGFKCEAETEKNRKRIRDVLGATESDWDSWKWQMDNRITKVEVLDRIIDLTEKEKGDIKKSWIYL